jgi:hypothetical protein
LCSNYKIELQLGQEKQGRGCRHVGKARQGVLMGAVATDQTWLTQMVSESVILYCVAIQSLSWYSLVESINNYHDRSNTDFVGTSLLWGSTRLQPCGLYYLTSLSYYGGLRHAQSHGPCSECRPPRFHPACMFDLQSLNLTHSPFATLQLSAHLSGTSLIALCLSRSPDPLQRMN